MKELAVLFAQVINEDLVKARTGISHQSIRQLRLRVAEGKPIKEETMRDVLTKLGYHCVQQEMWALKVNIAGRATGKGPDPVTEAMDIIMKSTKKKS